MGFTLLQAKQYACRSYAKNTGSRGHNLPKITQPPNNYLFASDDPIAKIDFLGLSQRDVTDIEAMSIKAFFALCKGCKRCDNGFDGLFWYNNDLQISFGAPYLACGDQALFAQEFLQNTLNNADDQWTPDIPQVFTPLPHQYLTLTSSDPDDPYIEVDLYQGVIVVTYPYQPIPYSANGLFDEVDTINMTCKPHQWNLTSQRNELIPEGH